MKKPKIYSAAMERLAENKTLCIIAHRISTIVNAHKIYLLEDGCIMARNHQELIKNSPEYVELLARQASLVSFDEVGGEI